MTDSKEGEVIKKQLSQQPNQEESKTPQELPIIKGGEPVNTPSDQQEKPGSRKKFRPHLPRLATAAMKLYLVPTPVHRPSEEKKIAIENNMDEEQYQINEGRGKCSYCFSKVLSVLPYIIIGFALGMAVHFLLEFRALVNDRPVPQVPASLVHNLPSFNDEPLHMNYFPYHQSLSKKEKEGKDEGSDNLFGSKSSVTGQAQMPTTYSTTEAHSTEAESTSTEEPALSIKVKTDFLNPKFSEILSKLTAPILDSATQFMKDPLFSKTADEDEEDGATDLVSVDSPAPGVMIIGRLHGNIGAHQSEMKNAMDNAMKGLLGKLFGQHQRSSFRPSPLQLMTPNSKDIEEAESFNIPPQIQREISQTPPPFVMEQISNIVKNVPGKIKSVRVTSSFTPQNPFQRLFKHMMGPSIDEMIPEDETIYPDPPFSIDQEQSMSVMRPRAIFGRTLISRPSDDSTVRLFPFVSRPASLSQIDSEIGEFPKRNHEPQRGFKFSSIRALPLQFPRVSIERLPQPIIRVRPFHKILPEEHVDQTFEAPEGLQEEMKAASHQHEDQGSSRVLLKDIINTRNPSSNQIFRNDRPEFLGLNFPPFPDLPASPLEIPDSVSRQREDPPVLAQHRRIPPFQLLNRLHSDSPRQHRRFIAVPRAITSDGGQDDSHHRIPNWINSRPDPQEDDRLGQHHQSEDLQEDRPESRPRPFLPLPILSQLPAISHTGQNTFKPQLDKISEENLATDLQNDSANNRKIPSLFLPFLNKILPVLRPLSRNPHQFHPEAEPTDFPERDQRVLPDVEVPEDQNVPDSETYHGIWDADSYSSYDSLPSDTILSLPMMGFASVPGTDDSQVHSPPDQNGGNHEEQEEKEGDEELVPKYPEFSRLPAEVVEPFLEIDSQESFDANTEDLNEAEKSVFSEATPDMEVQNDQIQEHVVFPVDPVAENIEDLSNSGKIGVPSSQSVDVPASVQEVKQMTEAPEPVGVASPQNGSDGDEDQRGMVDVDAELEATD